MKTTNSEKTLVKYTTVRNAPNKQLHSGNVRVPPDPSGRPVKVFRMILRSLIAIILVWAALSKLGDPVSTYTTLLEYRLPAPGILLKLVAVVLPWLELLCALMLLANFHRRLATLSVSVLFSVFLIMVGQAEVRGLNISCGCFDLTVFGINESSPSGRFIESLGFAFVRNLILLGAALYLLRDDGGAETTTNRLAGAGQGLP